MKKHVKNISDSLVNSSKILFKGFGYSIPALIVADTHWSTGTDISLLMSWMVCWLAFFYCFFIMTSELLSTKEEIEERKIAEEEFDKYLGRFLNFRI